MELDRRELFARATAVGALASAGGLASYGIFRAFHEPLHTEVTVRLPNLPRALDGFKIVQLTDIHIGDILGDRFLQELVDRTNAQKPDLVAITGDLVDGSVDSLGRTINKLQNLRSRYGTYFCTGNHEYYSGADEWCEALTKMGITVLRNRGTRIGVDDWGSRRQHVTSGYDLSLALKDRDPSRASVLLAHQPQTFSDTVKAGIGLQLSGHTHGGQLFPATVIAKLIYRSLLTGLHAEGDSHVFISRGCGFWGPPMRVGSPPEIVTLHLLA